MLLTYAPRQILFVCSTLLAFLLLTLPRICAAESNPCFLRDGDRWVFYGDSITASGVYPRMVERVFRHFHPEAKVTFRNNAQGGKQAAGATAAQALQGDPTVVSIMLGMNDAINSAWTYGKPVEPELQRYRENLTRLVRDIRAKNVEVVLMTPTLTDEACGLTIFRLEGTTALLAQMGKVCEEVAAAEGVPCLPAQQVFEDDQRSRPLPQERLRYDGVHAGAAGHYRLAQMFWQRLNFAAPLTAAGQPRRLSDAPALLPVTLAAAERFLTAPGQSPVFRLRSDAPRTVELKWSAPDAEGKILSGGKRLTVQGSVDWTPDLPAGVLPAQTGKVATVVIEAAAPEGRAVFIADLSRNRVLPVSGGVAHGFVSTDDSRPDAPHAADFTLQVEGKTLTFQIQVKDAALVQDTSNGWPWNGDSITLFLDLRPGERFGRNNFDGDVYQLWFQPRSRPAFSPGLRPWYGKQLENALAAFGEKTADGYRVGFVADGWLNLHQQFDASKLDFIGFDLTLTDFAEPRKKTGYYPFMKTELPVFLYANCLAILDLKGKLNADAATLVNLFPNN